MEFKTCQSGEVIFREGDIGECMYSVQYGRVGIYTGFNTADEKKIAELYPDNYFGEMGLIDHEPRSATAVALDNETYLEVITEDSFQEFFTEKPVVVLDLMQQMSSRLRNITKDYLDACITAHETAEADKKQEEKSPSLLESIKKFSRLYLGIGNT